MIDGKYSFNVNAWDESGDIRIIDKVAKEAVDGYSELKHTGRSKLDGAPIGSGRHPLGSGEQPWQHVPWRRFQLQYANLQAKRNADGTKMTQTQIAQAMGFDSLKDFRAQVTRNKEQATRDKMDFVLSKYNEGMSLAEIAEATGGVMSKSSVKQYVDKFKENGGTLSIVAENKMNRVRGTAEMLKDQLKNGTGYLDIGKGAEELMNVKRTTLDAAISQLKDEGYYVHTIYNQRLGDKEKGTKIKTLSQNPSIQDIWKNHLYDIEAIGVRTEDGGETYKTPEGIKPPKQLSLDRVAVKFKEQGGADADGLILLRPGVEDLSLGKSNYAQVRIAVGGKYYLKGMCAYSDDIPDGYDVLFNTNKSITGGKEAALKKLNLDNPSNPFDSNIKPVNGQRGYLNIVNEEGDWSEWTHDMAAQFLSKQNYSLVRDRLKATVKATNEEYETILKIENPVLQRQLLEDFAGSCQTRARQLKAKGTAGACAQVLMPSADVKPNEIYAPNFKDGDRVVLVRYPHAGRFELAELTVNNHNQSAENLIGKHAQDAVVIHPSVAPKLSGADYDGDTVFVFKNNNGRIKVADGLPGLKDFDTKDWKAVDLKPGEKTITKKYRGNLMGCATNLIADMQNYDENTPPERIPTRKELEDAVKFSMVVIDAYKHDLDWRAAAEEYHYKELRRKYCRTINPETGKNNPIGSSSVITRAKRHMEEVDDATKLYSMYPTKVEKEYAAYANTMKAMQNTALKAAAEIKTPAWKPELGKKGGEYYNEVQSLDEKYAKLIANKPKERQAQILTSKWYNQQKKLADIKDADDAKKLRVRLERTARQVTGSEAFKYRIEFTDREWEAIQAGAVSPSKQAQLFRSANADKLRERALPKSYISLTTGQKAAITRMASKKNSSGGLAYSPTEIANKLGVSVSDVQKWLHRDGE